MNVSFFSASVTGAYLEAEVHPNAAGKFEADYLQITGEMPVIGEGYQHNQISGGLSVVSTSTAIVISMMNFLCLALMWRKVRALTSKNGDFALTTMNSSGH